MKLGEVKGIAHSYPERECLIPKPIPAKSLFYCPPHPNDQPLMGQASCRDLGFSRKDTDPGPILEELSPMGAMNIVIML